MPIRASLRKISSYLRNRLFISLPRCFATCASDLNKRSELFEKGAILEHNLWCLLLHHVVSFRSRSTGRLEPTPRYSKSCFSPETLQFPYSAKISLTRDIRVFLALQRLFPLFVWLPRSFSQRPVLFATNKCLLGKCYIQALTARETGANNVLLPFKSQ